jgi:hypothetical protein
VVPTSVASELPDGYRDSGKGTMYELPDGTTIGQRPIAESNGRPALDINVPGDGYTKVHVNPRGGVPEIPAKGAEPIEPHVVPRTAPPPVVEPVPAELPPAEGGLPGDVGGAPGTPIGPTIVPMPHSIHHPFPILGEDDPGTPAEDFEP